MLYMVELDFQYPERMTDWEAWYAGHLKKLLSIPGFRSAQRFRSVAPTPSPYLAIYGIASAAVMEGPEYRAKAGPVATGEWRTLMTNWQRNLVDGLDQAPAVAPDQRLAVIDRLTEAAPALPAGFARLTPVGLDRSVVERGLRVYGPGETAPEAGDRDGVRVRVFRPLTPYLTPGSV